jgi:hypothetical protein
LALTYHQRVVRFKAKPYSRSTVVDRFRSVKGLTLKISLVWVIAPALCLCASAAVAGHERKFVCKRQSGGPMSDFTLTIDLDEKQIDVPSRTGFQPDEAGAVAITNGSVEWSFMRGFAKYNRRTGELDWDTSPEYAYLEEIGQPSGQPESDFRGRVQCEKAGLSH